MAERNLQFEISLAELDNIVVDANASYNDSDLTNILYFGEIPNSSYAQDDQLRDLFSAVEDWKAWETTKCEQSVQDKITKKLLPNDLSDASRAKRTAYRAKVLEYLRNRSPWIVSAGSPIGDKVPVAAVQPLNLAIVDTLVNIEPWATNIPYRNFLKAVGAAFSPGSDMVQPCYHTIIGFQYDSVDGKFQAVLLTVSFTIDMGEHGGSDRVKPSSELVIEYTSTPAIFLEDQWTVTKPDPATTKAGRELNLQRSLTVIAPADDQ